MIPSMEKLLRDFYREQNIDKHEAQKASWGWFGRSQHWLFASWRCPACKAAKTRRADETVKKGDNGN